MYTRVRTDVASAHPPRKTQSTGNRHKQIFHHKICKTEHFFLSGKRGTRPASDTLVSGSRCSFPMSRAGERTYYQDGEGCFSSTHGESSSETVLLHLKVAPNNFDSTCQHGG
jgi:hypothetical protein